MNTLLRSFLLLLLASVPLSAQAFLNANGPGNTFEEITNAFAPGNDTSCVEDPQCIHPQYGRHVAEVWDAEQGKYVYEFYMHVAIDNDRCINFDRQRVEIKTYDPSPDALKGVTGETMTFKWRFRVPVGFKPSSSFTHIHQIKAVGGLDDDPLITLTVRKGSPNKLELIHNNTTKETIVSLSAFEGNWVEATEVIKVDSLHGTYSIVIKDLSDGTTLLSYSNSDLMTIRWNNTFIRPKWGIYRSLNSPADLRDDSLRFSDFYIGEATTTTLPNAPTSLSASIASATQINLAWTDNASNEESYSIERSTNGTTWSVIATASPNATTYSNTGITSSTQYYYRVRAVNTFGNSSYSNTAASISGQILSLASGNWSATSTWVGGAVPTATDNVIINSGNKVTVDNTSAVCNDVTINDTLTYGTTDSCSLTVNGNMTIASGAAFMPTAKPTAGNAIIHSLTAKGNISCSGGFDMRIGTGSNPFTTIAAVTITFSGTGTSTVSLPDSADLNSVTINKTGGGKVVITNNVMQNNNSTTAPSVLTLTSGVIETGNYTWNVYSTASGSVVGGSTASHVKGSIARGWPSTGTASNKPYPLGDGTVYRPAFLSNTSSVFQLVSLRLMSGDGNTGSSTLANGLYNVSDLRYYTGSVKVIPSKSPQSFTLVGAGIGYNTDDGVQSGNTNLRVALSTDERATWTSIGPTNHTTSLVSTPVTITSTALSQSIAYNANFSLTLGNINSSTNPLPVELRSFTLSSVRGLVTLHWSTATEQQNIGFSIERKGSGEWEAVGFVHGSGATNAPAEYRWTDNAVPPGTYAYRLKQLDADGGIRYSSVLGTRVERPNTFALRQNYPNPFNPTTAIEYTLPMDGPVRIDVYNDLGQQVAQIVNGFKNAGSYTVLFNASSLPSGMYLCTMTAGTFTAMKKMNVVK